MHPVPLDPRPGHLRCCLHLQSYNIFLFFARKMTCFLKICDVVKSSYPLKKDGYPVILPVGLKITNMAPRLRGSRPSVSADLGFRTVEIRGRIAAEVDDYLFEYYSGIEG